jgi:hypothetical protein
MELLVGIAVIALVIWLLTNFIPMDPKFQQLIIVVGIVIVIVMLLRWLGLGGSYLGRVPGP